VLVVHRSERADRLVEALGDLLVVASADPLEAEVVAVPTRGVERWLTQRLSHRLGAGDEGGVCANLQFPFPGTLVRRAVAAACDLDPDDDPWLPERAVWPLLDLVDEHNDDPALAVLVAHLRATTPGASNDPLRRFSGLRRAADRFDHYGVHRPALILSWCAGAGDGWQPHLWRLLRERIGVPSPAERFAEASRRLAASADLVDLPGRLSLFGLTRLPASHLDVLQGLAVGRDVHLMLLHPSAVLWDRVAAHLAGIPAGLARDDDPTSRMASNPLLRSWGRDAREMQLVLAGRGVTASVHHGVGSDGTDAEQRDRERGAPSPPSVLAALQAGVRDDTRPPGDPGPAGPGGPSLGERRLVIDPGDTSLRVHVCHGRARQVEVARDAVLHLLAADPTLEARDVIVCCPDVESFAPLVQAVFGADSAGGTPSGRLRVRLADRSLRQTNPLLSVAASLLELAGGRAGASEVLDFAARPVVARRFRLDGDALVTLGEWVAASGVRWGFDAEHRRRWELPSVTANTWEAGLDRVLLGVAMEGPGLTWAETVPVEGVTSGSVELAGRLAELVARLASVLSRLRDPQPVSDWVEALVTGTEMLALGAPGEEWQHQQLRRVLSEAAGESPAQPSPLLALAEVRSLLAARLQGRPTTANFRTGDLTVCTLVPMRSVPHRVVVLLGLDDGSFPRRPEPDGDDLLAEVPEVGDRDSRSEDRQLLLDALMAATDHLVVTYAGRDERTNRARPPAAPIAELLDVLDASFCRADGCPARASVLVEHPLHSFDRRNFAPGGPGGDRPWGFDPVDLDGARAASRQVPPPVWLPEMLAPLDAAVVSLDDLIRFVEHPVRTFLRRRLGLFVDERSSPLDDEIPLELDALEAWAVGDRLLGAALAGVSLDRAADVELRRGLLPPGALGAGALTGIVAEVEELLGVVASLGLPAVSSGFDVRVDLPAARSVFGTVSGVRGDTLVSCVYSRLAPKHRLAAWVRFLALSAARPELELSALSIGRGGGGAQPPLVARLAPLGADADERMARATGELHRLVALADLGLRRALPIACRTSATWAASRLGGNDSGTAREAASEVWEGGYRFPGERDDPEHVEVFGPASRFDDLAGDPDFETLAIGLWQPLLAHERIAAAASKVAVPAARGDGEGR